MFARVVVLLLLVTVGALWFATRSPAPPPAPPRPPGGLAPFEGRAALDHQGQPAASMPGDEPMDPTH